MPSPVASGTVSTLRVGLRVQPGPTQVRLGTQPRSTNDEVRLAWPGGLKAFQSFSDLEKGRHPSSVTLARQEPKFKSFQFRCGALAGQSESATGHRCRGREKAFQPDRLVAIGDLRRRALLRRCSPILRSEGDASVPGGQMPLGKIPGETGPPACAAQKVSASMADIGRPKR